VSQDVAGHDLEFVAGLEVEARHHLAHGRDEVDGTSHCQADRVSRSECLEKESGIFAVLETLHEFLKDLLGAESVGVESRHQRTHGDAGDFAHRDLQLFDGFEDAGMTGSLGATGTKNDFDPLGVKFHGNLRQIEGLREKWNEDEQVPPVEAPAREVTSSKANRPMAADSCSRLLA